MPLCEGAWPHDGGDVLELVCLICKPAVISPPCAPSQVYGHNEEAMSSDPAQHVCKLLPVLLPLRGVQVYGRIKEAMEMAEEARLARDGVIARHRELERENDNLQQRLANLRQVGAAGGLVRQSRAPVKAGGEETRRTWSACGAL